MRLGGGDTPDESVEHSAFGQSYDFRDAPNPLAGIRGSGIPGGVVDIIAAESSDTRSESMASTKSILRLVNGLLQFCFEGRGETSACVTRGQRMALSAASLNPYRGDGDPPWPMGNTRLKYGIGK